MVPIALLLGLFASCWRMFTGAEELVTGEVRATRDADATSPGAEDADGVGYLGLSLSPTSSGSCYGMDREGEDGTETSRENAPHEVRGNLFLHSFPDGSTRGISATCKEGKGR